MHYYCRRVNTLPMKQDEGPPAKRTKSNPTSVSCSFLGLPKDVWRLILAYLSPQHCHAFGKLCHAARRVYQQVGPSYRLFPVACCTDTSGRPETCTRFTFTAPRFLKSETLLQQGYEQLLSRFPLTLRTAAYRGNYPSVYLSYSRAPWKTCRVCQYESVALVNVELAPLFHNPERWEAMGIGTILYELPTGSIYSGGGKSGFTSDYVRERDGPLDEGDRTWRDKYNYISLLWVRRMAYRQCLLCCLCEGHLEQTKPFFCA